jgi:hypothetical protein
MKRKKIECTKSQSQVKYIIFRSFNLLLFKYMFNQVIINRVELMKRKEKSIFFCRVSWQHETVKKSSKVSLTFSQNCNSEHYEKFIGLYTIDIKQLKERNYQRKPAEKKNKKK